MKQAAGALFECASDFHCNTKVLLLTDAPGVPLSVQIGKSWRLKISCALKNCFYMTIRIYVFSRILLACSSCKSHDLLFAFVSSS